MDGKHELVGRVVVLNSGGPLMTIVAVSAWLVADREELIGEPPPTEYEVVHFDAGLCLRRGFINESWVELLTDDDLDKLTDVGIERVPS